MSQIDDVRTKTDIVEVIGASGVNLRKAGRSFVGFCPFHPNSRTPAFTVYPDSQSFYCFGCHASGTVFDYVMRKQGLDFKDALEQLAARAGVRLEPKGDQERQEDARRTRLLEINAAAAKYFNYVLVSLARGEPGREYVAKRGLTPQTVESFQIGFSLDEWTHLFAYLTGKKGYTPEDVEAAGLAINHETRGHYDRFRGRLIFPIRDAKGQVVGFGGRALGDAQPKYLNTPETLLFKKGELLYGLDLARDAIRSEDRTVVVEGYVDVITAHQYGFRNVVAPLGTAITRGHVALLKRLSHNISLALDADAAGQRATLKGLNAINESTEESELTRSTISGQGEVIWESDIVLRVIKMPKGQDPDEVIKSDPELWRAVVQDAKPVIDFLIEINIADLDVTKSDDLRVALDRLTPILSKLDDRQQRVYSTVLERITGVRADILLAQLKEPARKRPTKPQRPLPAPPKPAVEQPAPDTRVDERRTSLVNPRENYLLSLALRYSVVVPAAVEALLEQSLELFPSVREMLGGGLEDLLEDPANQQIWAAFTALPIEGRPAGEEALQAWANWLEEPLRERFLAVLFSGQRHPEDFRYRQVAEDYARSLRTGQTERFIHRLNEQIIAVEDLDEQQRISEQMKIVGFYAYSLKHPRRTTTFTDLRDTLGKA